MRNLPERVYREFDCEIRAVGDDASAQQFDFVISSANPDRYGDTVAVDGWSLKNFRKTGSPVLFGHDSRSLPIAQAKRLRVEDSKLVATVDFTKTADVNPLAAQVLAMVQRGVLRSTSVGFVPIEAEWNDERKGYDFLKQELLEFSIVPVPANADAVRLSAEEAGVLRGWALGILSQDEEFAVIEHNRLEAVQRGLGCGKKLWGLSPNSIQQKVSSLTKGEVVVFPDDEEDAPAAPVSVSVAIEEAISEELRDLVQELRTEIDQLRAERTALQEEPQVTEDQLESANQMARLQEGLDDILAELTGAVQPAAAAEPPPQAGELTVEHIAHLNKELSTLQAAVTAATGKVFVDD